MSAGGSRIAAMIVAAAVVALIAWAPDRLGDVFRNFLALSNLARFLFAAAVLVWFVYTVILRRILRARRIANARMRRLLREAGGGAETNQHR